MAEEKSVASSSFGTPLGYEADDDDDEDFVEPSFIQDTHRLQAPIASDAPNSSFFVNVGQITWLATRDHWRRRPPDYNRAATIETMKRNFSDLDFETIHEDLAGKRNVKVPLAALIQSLAAEWEEEGLQA